MEDSVCMCSCQVGRVVLSNTDYHKYVNSNCKQFERCFIRSYAKLIFITSAHFLLLHSLIYVSCCGTYTQSHRIACYTSQVPSPSLSEAARGFYAQRPKFLTIDCQRCAPTWQRKTVHSALSTDIGNHASLRSET